MPTQTAASRGYVLFRGAIRDTRKSAHCLRCVGHVPASVSKRGRDTESAAKLWLEEIRAFFPDECSSCFSPGIWHAVLPAILFTPEEPCMPPVKTTICFLSSKQDFYDMLFLCIQLFDPLLFDPHGICCPRFRFQLLFIAEDTFYPLFFTLALFRI